MTPLLLAFWLAVQAAVPATQAKPSATPASQAANGRAPEQGSVRVPLSVTFANGKLTITAADCGLNEVLRAVSHQTNVPIEGRLDGDERVAVKIGPAPLRDVLLTLLQGSHYSFVLLSRESQPENVEKIVLMSRLSAPTPEAAQQPEQAPTIDEVPMGTVISPDETDPDAPPPPPRQPSVTGPDGKPVAVPKIINSTPLQPAPKGMQPSTPEPATPGVPK